MYSLNVTLCFLLFALTGCQHASAFDRAVWLQNPAMEDTHNPRAWMVQDVMENHLHAGMARPAVIALLGEPYQEGIERRLPIGTKIPDSVTGTNERLKPDVAVLNNFMRDHAKPVLVMRYAVGWSTIDPNFLLLLLDSRGVVQAYWVEQG